MFNGQTGQHVGFVNQEGRILNSWIGAEALYNVENLRTGLKAWVSPPTLDPKNGVVGPTPFSDLDFYVRKFRPEEDRRWPHKAEHEMGFEIHENPDDGDIVFWSIGHLFHHFDPQNLEDSKEHWHEVGPEITVEILKAASVSPENRRCLNLRGHIHVKDFKAVGHDLWGHYEFDENLLVDPNSPHAEVQIRRGPTGDITADLLFRIDWRADQSVAVNFSAHLYDEQE